MELSIIKGTQGIYVHRTTALKDHDFGQPERADLFDRIGDTFSDPAVYARDDDFWEKERTVGASANESRVEQLMARLRGVKLYYYGEKILKIFSRDMWPPDATLSLT